ncbi:Uncharacterised protein [Bordetella pertussis]|nr:Uncharacterised protein [Bordetella pertussis]CFW92630.1 Uncharacterised protein [Bordetella pertussis]CPJ94842.1 Uncharacterised protein [Bordetella pertussis]CPL53081.1 Uncharacterised protein [Bordetella pertussis]
MGGQFARIGQRLVGPLGCRRHAIDQSPLQRLRGVDGFGAQQQRQRAAAAQQMGQRMGHAGIGRGAQFQVGRDQPRVVGGDRQVAGQRQGQARAGGHAVHIGQPQLVHGGDARHAIVERREQRPQAGADLLGRALEQGDVAAGAKGLAGAAQQHHAQRRAVLQPAGRGLQVARHGDVDGIERGGAVQGKDGERAIGLQGQGAIARRLVGGGHGSVSVWGKYQFLIQKPRCYVANQALARLGDRPG